MVFRTSRDASEPEGSGDVSAPGFLLGDTESLDSDDGDHVDACLFCQDFGGRVLFSNPHFCAIYDAYPANPGHLLIISRRHIADLFGLYAEEFAGLYEMIGHAKTLLDEKYRPGGYNIGANCGEVAGQTIPHFHLHVIPRYPGDVDEPRGGVRNIMEAGVSYPEEP